MHTAVALIQEPWLLNGVTRVLEGSEKLFFAKSRKNACLTKEINSTFLPQLIDDNQVTAKLSFRTEEGMEGPTDYSRANLHALRRSGGPPPVQEVNVDCQRISKTVKICSTNQYIELSNCSRK